MSNVDVVYLVEYISRELDIACAVKSEARRRHGLEVDVRSIVFDLDGPPAERAPRVFVAPFFGSRKSFGVRKAVAHFHGAAAINLQFEQLVSQGNAAIKGPRDHVAQQQVLQCAVGDFYADFLTSRSTLKENIVLTGSLPCQLYREPYRRFYEGRRNELAERFGVDPSRRWVFYPENCGAAFFSERQKRQRIRYGYDASDLEDYCRHSRNAFRETMSWCADAARLDDAEIIIRPRPSTPHNAFLAALHEAVGPIPERRLHILKDYSVREWVIASDAVISSFSTTLLESALAGKPTYLLAPEPLPESMRSSWHDEAARITERSRFLDIVRADELSPPNRLSHWAGEHLLAYGDAIGNVVDLLADIVSGRRPGPTLRLTPLQLAMEWLYLSGKAASRKVRSKIRRRRDKYHEADRFTAEDVASRTARWDEVLGGPPESSPLRRNDFFAIPNG